jgi:hypothetical protein
VEDDAIVDELVIVAAGANVGKWEIWLYDEIVRACPEVPKLRPTRRIARWPHSGDHVDVWTRGQEKARPTMKGWKCDATGRPGRVRQPVPAKTLARFD